MLIPVNLPPGMYKNGTPYTRKGRWEDGNLVRWHDGAIRPIGGWLRRQNTGGSNIATLISDDTLEAVRDIFAWRDSGGGLEVVFGSNLALYHMDEVGTITDVTYGTYSSTGKDPSTVAGFGQNPYGLGAYGSANNLIGQDPTPPARWYFDNFGEVLITGSRNNGGVYELDLGTLTLSAVSNAPASVQDLVVTDQRQVFAVGTDGEPRRVRTSDVEDRTDWTPAINNQSIDRVLAGAGKLLCCHNVLRSVLILGETDAHVARYIGPPYVYSIDLAGEKCGPLATEAVAITDRFAVWWGARNFWLYDGSVQQVPCDVIDFLYADLDPNAVSKISCYTNTEFSEITWLYQSLTTTTTEVDSYVTWDYRENHWTVGRLDRTCGIDRGVPLDPIMVSHDGFIYNHELSDVLPTGGPYVESGPIDLKNGQSNMAIRYIYPDTEGTGNVSFTIYGRQLPNATEYTYGPYSYQQNNPIPTRALGRSIRIRADLDDALSEIGTLRLDAVPMGGGQR